MKTKNKFKRQSKQNSQENKTFVFLKKVCGQSALRKTVDYVLWEAFDLDGLASWVISLIEDFFDD
jgi:hypothetical protein